MIGTGDDAFTGFERLNSLRFLRTIRNMSTSPLPGDASNDPSDDQTGRFVVQPNGRVRPLSPHLQIWRWHVTMLASILNRAVASSLGSWLRLPLPQGQASSTVFRPSTARLTVLATGCGKG